MEECDVRSTLSIRPKLSDDNNQLRCVVKHEALSSKMSMFSTVQLVVNCKNSTKWWVVIYFMYTSIYGFSHVTQIHQMHRLSMDITKAKNCKKDKKPC